MEKSLENLNIWVTGASRGIGAAIARSLSKTGATLFLSASKKESFNDLLIEFKDKDNVYFFPFDVSSRVQAQNVYAKIEMISGGVDILINNAGIGIFKPMTDMKEKDFDDMIGINLKGPFLCMKAVLPKMIEKKFGAIINVQSISAYTDYVNSSIYGAAKAGAIAMDRSLRNEVRDKGIKVVDISPGATETGIWAPKLREKYGPSMMQPEDVADAVNKAVELCLNDRMMVEEMIVRPQGGDLK